MTEGYDPNSAPQVGAKSPTLPTDEYGQNLSETKSSDINIFYVWNCLEMFVPMFGRVQLLSDSIHAHNLARDITNE